MSFQSVALCFDADGDGEQQSAQNSATGNAIKSAAQPARAKAAKCIEPPVGASYQANTAARTSSELVTADFTSAKASVPASAGAGLDWSRAIARTSTPVREPLPQSNAVGGVGRSRLVPQNNSTIERTQKIHPATSRERRREEEAGFSHSSPSPFLQYSCSREKKKHNPVISHESTRPADYQLDDWFVFPQISRHLGGAKTSSGGRCLDLRVGSA